MAREEKCILTNMCMIYDGNNILVQDRRKKDWPGVTFPGGHVEEAESIVESTIREIKEETGLTISNLHLCGIKHWSDKERKLRYIVFFFKTNTYSGKLISSHEGEMFWIDKKDLNNYTLAPGFDKMFEVFENENLSENFHFEEDGNWQVENK